MISDLIVNLTANFLRTYLLFRYHKALYGKSRRPQVITSFNYLLFATVPVIIYICFHHPLLNLISNLTFIFIITLRFEASWKSRIISTLMFYGLNIICDVISIYALYPYKLGGDYNLFSLYIMVLLLAIFEFPLELIIRRHNKQDSTMPYWGIMILVPLTSVALIFILLMVGGLGRIVILCLCVLLLWINFFTFFLYYHLVEAIANERENLIYKLKAEEYSNQMDIELQSAERIRSLRHDMKNHMSELAGLIKCNETEKALSFIGDIDCALQNPKEYSKSGNRELDSMQNYLLREAEDLGINVKIDGAAPKRLCISEFDLTVIIGNLVDNAVTAASQADDKWIDIKICFDKDLLHYVISNSFSGEVRKDLRGNFLSSKMSPAEHGIGLRNVGRVVSKNGGTVEFIEDSENHVFSADVMLYAGGMRREA